MNYGYIIRYLLEMIISPVVHGTDGRVPERLPRTSGEAISVVLVTFNGKISEDANCRDPEQQIDSQEIECLMD